MSAIKSSAKFLTISGQVNLGRLHVKVIWHDVSVTLPLPSDSMALWFTPVQIRGNPLSLTSII